MGKWLKKAIKSGLYGVDGPHHRRHHRHPHHISGSSSSSSDSDGYQYKRPKHMKKYMKHMHKWHHLNNDNKAIINDNKAICSLCCHQIKPLVETEILECGHIYHRLCLKDLVNISLNRNEENKVLCTQCKTRISDQLMDTFKTRLEVLIPTEEPNVENQRMQMN